MGMMPEEIRFGAEFVDVGQRPDQCELMVEGEDCEYDWEVAWEYRAKDRSSSDDLRSGSTPEPGMFSSGEPNRFKVRDLITVMVEESKIVCINA